MTHWVPLVEFPNDTAFLSLIRIIVKPLEQTMFEKSNRILLI